MLLKGYLPILRPIVEAGEAQCRLLRLVSAEIRAQCIYKCQTSANFLKNSNRAVLRHLSNAAASAYLETALHYPARFESRYVDHYKEPIAFDRTPVNRVGARIPASYPVLAKLA